ncbi:LytR/AlgR family response regulator transcription factor [Undibacterium fentianense]|uniref:Response regulator transcription factor n=1 Tax=Undibacterium fentianense TaxID=2828728 RepID=A0A941EAJ2_9BURK|nr:LytTR family DNA-binding domain-containing protein [Undibacterium fentianense]MBR7801563.1 response regulator transcription factor [Undibacterium fentianense]
MNIKILIAEDEPLMQTRLRTLLEKLWPEANIVMIAENGNDAWDGFLEHQPELVFLDIRMPGLSGLQVAQKIGHAAHIVFITAYDQYAIEAFEAGAIDYLLKPVQEERLEKSLQRVEMKLRSNPADISAVLKNLQALMPSQKHERIKWIKASVGKQIRLIDVDDILFFQSDTKYTRVVLAEFEALVRTPLKDLLEGLDTERYWQVHRSTVVNVKAIAAAERLDAERMQLLIKGHAEKLLVSRNFTHLFRD